ncbi:uncharacterized protein LOC103309988 [Acyrthosiphon pisum]|uniref:Peptidase aspartic putative domain-containing protein n=1 Tax=Acyrthosiphon pisum TaxID=7029 RepID=A0A8R2B798_ACYPI|nr:uncharacterized protein LOC103309988 [Acyrthosiphon pisum]|eukprot:XP_008185105.1 PREDICTED: uncharacterized protein LOC103309988 [Acyrthosiphon pisum]
MVLDDSDKKVLGDLRRKRGVVKASLTRIRTFVQNFRPAVDAITLLEFRQEQLPEVNRKFDDVQSQIELIDVDNAAETDKEREEFENDYFAIRSEMQELINAEKSQNSSIQNNTMNSMPMQRARLAPLTIPKFDGNIQEWESYFDCFKGMVHNEDAYPPAQKFSYLRSSLSGAALDVIKAIPMTENNYAVAIKRLQQRFENRSMVIQSHIRAILDFPQVQSAVANDLQALHSNIVAHVAALEALGQPVDMWDAWLVTVLLRKVDHGTCHEWQIRRTNNELPKYKELEEFLANRCIAFENSETWDNSNTGTKKKSTNPHTGKRVTLAATEDKSDKCPCCNLMHKLYHCERFKELPQSNRFNIVRSARLCFNCLSPYHMAPACQSKSVCQRCKNKHNTLLHYEKSSQGYASRQYTNEDEDSQTSSTPPDQRKSSVHSCLAAKPTDTHVFLSTAIVQVTDSRGFMRDTRAVLDSGSMVNFISRSLLNVLQFNTQKTSLPIRGVGASQVQSVAKVEVHVYSKVTNYRIMLPCFVLLTVVSELPACNTPTSNWNIPFDLRGKLADPKFDKVGSVDLLIGAGIFYELLEAERVSLGIGNLSLQDTKLGWVVTGGLEVTCLLGINSLGETMESDWKAILADEQQYGKGSKANQRCEEEEETLQHFKKSVRRSEDGRFVLRLPTKPETQNLGDSLAMATSRFINIERRIQRDEQLRVEYVKFMKEYFDMGHMREVTSEEELFKKGYYLPHHPVLKASSLTTKTRVVFDGSARTTSGLALNDVLMRGPTVQEDIFSILVRFRKHQYVITADIEKMFRQIMIAPEDCHLQRILWRANPSEKLRTYNLLTITYGTTPASFMATQCLVTLAEEIEKENPKVAEVISRDFYMDDLMTGCDTVEECMQLQKHITVILESAKLPLRKWCSNSHLIIANISENDKDPLVNS